MIADVATESGACAGAKEGGSGPYEHQVRSTGGGASQGINRPTVIPPCTQSWGSQQWRMLRRAIRDGVPLEQAAAANNMSLIEARALINLDAEREPLPPEAFTLLYDPAARAAQPQEPDMADNDDDEVTELKQMDFAKAKRLYEADIHPEKTQAASHQQSVGEAYKLIKKDCHIQPQAAKVAFKIFEMEEAHGDDFLRGLAGLVNEMSGRTVLTFHGGDLVDMAENLAADLEGASKPDIFTEATDEELAAQTKRLSVEKAKAKEEAEAEAATEPKPGTGASARKRMKNSAPAEAAALH